MTLAKDKDFNTFKFCFILLFYPQESFSLHKQTLWKSTTLIAPQAARSIQA